MEVLPSSPRHPPKYGSAVVQDALEQLASIDLIELCKEARIERCRATRDLSSCGRYVQHVLNSCGHASLCAECSQRCDVCPICRIPIPDNGDRVRLRLYYKCMAAGLISKQHDDRFQEKEDHGNHMNMDIQRLYSLFDVALQNNLVSLICHYIMDVCMDENAVSSDPVLAFLLDEVVIKDWCKRAVIVLISEIHVIYKSELETMKSKLQQLQKFAVQLTGVSNVLEVMISSFKETFLAQVDDLHQLFESTVKAKQHLEVMIWCIRHQFLQNVHSRFLDFASWDSHVLERKVAAKERMWPDFSVDASSSMESNHGILFVEQALENLGIERSYREKQKEELDILCLRDESSSPMFCSTIDQLSGNRYPFKNFRIATDVLFLHGESEMVVAKQAIFLYYLFDRHWTRPNSEWRYLVDDFAASFGINGRTLLECLVFCLLDDHSREALEEACHLLPKISGKETHPKIAQVLLERQRPDVALTVLQCSGGAGLSATANIEHDSFSSLREAVTAVRVRIEYGLLTEAFIYHRSYCSRVKEQRSEDMALSNNTYSWMYHVEVLVTEICNICIERNLVDTMIELPWNSDEDKHLHKCLFDRAREMPSSPYGSLLVVFYLQRYRYSEAYQVDRSLQNFEQSALDTASEDVASKIRSIAQWRQGLVAKCLELLPEVQRDEVKATSVGDDGRFPIQHMQVSSPVTLLDESPYPATQLNSSMAATVHKRLSPIHSRKVNAVTTSGSPINGSCSEFGRKTPSILQQRLIRPLGSPMPGMRSVADGIFLPIGQNGDIPHISSLKEEMHMKGQANQKKGLQPTNHPLPMSFHLSSRDTPMKDHSTSSLKPDVNKMTFSLGKGSVRKGQFDFGSRVEKSFIFGGTRVGQNDNSKISRTFEGADVLEDDTQEDDPQSMKVPIKEHLLHKFSTKTAEENNMRFPSLGKKSSPGDQTILKGGSRWRSDESSEDEDGGKTNGYKENGAAPATRRRARLPRR